MRLACVTVPNFRIALERRRAPQYARVPLAIGEPPPGENQVLDCSPEASALGIRAGMPLRDARTLVPDLVLLPPDPVFYARSSDALLDALEDVEPYIEPDGDGTVYAALDPAADGESQLAAAARLVAAVHDSAGIDASAGAGIGKFIAWCAATVTAPGETAVVHDGEEAAFVAPLSASFLPVPYDTQRKLALYGLRTIGDIAQLPMGALQAQFGREGRRLFERSRGIDPTPFRPRERKHPIVATLTMPAPTVNSAALIIAARQLVGRLLHQPSLRYRHVRQLRLRFALLDSGSWERTLTFREPLSDEDGIVFVLKKLIEPLQLAGPVDEMTLEFIGLTGETGKQRSLLFAEQARRRAQLLATLQQLKTRFNGQPQVTRVVEVEPWSRIPERRYALIDYDL
jgi:DNA polymerase-4/protein ImuB